MDELIALYFSLLNNGIKKQKAIQAVAEEAGISYSDFRRYLTCTLSRMAWE